MGITQLPTKVNSGEKCEEQSKLHVPYIGNSCIQLHTHCAYLFNLLSSLSGSNQFNLPQSKAVSPFLTLQKELKASALSVTIGILFNWTEQFPFSGIIYQQSAQFAHSVRLLQKLIRNSTFLQVFKLFSK